jgi:hypothetical protein
MCLSTQHPVLSFFHCSSTALLQVLRGVMFSKDVVVPA